MKRKKTASAYDGKSLRTFFLYAIAVILVIIIALAIKLFLVVRVSKFDGQHEFTIAIAVQGKVQEILSFDPTADSTSVLQIQNSQLSLSNLGKTLSIIPDATVDFSQKMILEPDAIQSLWQIIRNYNHAKKDFTFYDLGRLYLLSRSVTQVNRQEKSVTLPLSSLQTNKLISSLFGDSVISQDNMTVQIINASDVSGLGLRLENVLENQGANIVAITTAQAVVPHSTIQYFGEPSYTLKKISTQLKFPVSHLQQQAIADIVITIGEDGKNNERF